MPPQPDTWINRSPLFLLAAVLALASCSDGVELGDPLAGRSTQAPSSSSGSAAPPSGTSTNATEPPGGEDDGTSPAAAADGGATSAADAGAKPAANDAFAGAPAFVATAGPSTVKGVHGNGGNPAKLACVTTGCHGGGGGGPLFAAGGTVYKDLAATMPAANVEIRLLDAAGKSVLTHTDALGNFFVRATTATAAGLAFPNRTAARDATSTKPMVASIANGNCDGATCHGGGQGVIHVP